MKLFKKLVLGAAAVCALISFSPKQAQAADYTKNGPIIFGTNYTGTVEYDSTNTEDNYKLVVPSTGRVTLNFTYEAGAEDSYCVDIYNSNGVRVDGCLTEDSNTSKVTFNLAKGNYTFKIGYRMIGFDESTYGGTYNIKFSYSFSPSTNVRLSSPSKGAIKVVAANGDGGKGFQVRYKKAGAKKFTVKTFTTKKNLNRTLKKLKSKTKYIVQARVITKDSYGHTYYSSWTKQQKIKTK